MEIFTTAGLYALLQVIMIDLVLAGDNAIVIGLAAAGLPKEQRTKAILVGIIAATVMRIFFALITTQLLAIVGLLLAGGVLLLWVCWKMWRELRAGHEQEEEEAEEEDENEEKEGDDENRAQTKQSTAADNEDLDILLGFLEFHTYKHNCIYLKPNLEPCYLLFQSV